MDAAQSIIVCHHPERFLHVQLAEGSQGDLQKTSVHRGSFSWFHPHLPVAVLFVVVVVVA